MTKPKQPAAPAILRGRPPAVPDQLKDHTVRARVTAALAMKFDQLGGPRWLRKALTRAKVRDSL